MPSFIVLYCKESVPLAKSFLDACCMNMEGIPVQDTKMHYEVRAISLPRQESGSVSLIDYKVGGEGSHSANGTGALVYLFIKTVTKRHSFYWKLRELVGKVIAAQEGGAELGLLEST